MTNPMLDPEERARLREVLPSILAVLRLAEEDRWTLAYGSRFTPNEVAARLTDAATALPLLLDALEAVERERDRLLNRCIAVVSECDNSVPVFEIVERLSALARTPEGGTDGE